MIVTNTRFADVVVLALKGRLDQTTADDVRTELAPHLQRCAEGQDHLVLDLAGVDYVSSAGLRIFMIVGKALRAERGHIVLCRLQDGVREVFRISGFDRIFTILPTVVASVAQIEADG